VGAFLCLPRGPVPHAAQNAPARVAAALRRLLVGKNEVTADGTGDAAGSMALVPVPIGNGRGQTRLGLGRRETRRLAGNGKL
jgi:hypothetical protein